ncbi:MAG: HAD-IC family P-type ATPase [Patescibacteria group bacterium]|nr:HAD-IC family P-type ATPase [Patescibacteria group bacterium]
MQTRGLSTSEVITRRTQYGRNEVAEQKTKYLKKFVAPLFSPISIMLLGAAVLSRINGRVFDFYFILVLYVVNYSVQKWQEFKADRAIQELRKKLSFDVSVFRGGAWGFVPTTELVVGDYFRLGLGSIIPADATITHSAHVSINEAVLTGESLPKEKKEGDTIFSGSFVVTGNLEAEVSAVGKHTKFGKTIFSIEQPTGKSLLEKDILHISRFLTLVSIAAVAVLSVVFFLKGARFEDLLTLDLSLVIAGIPIAMPAVMAVILSIGAAGLAKKSTVVRRLSALQDLANVNLLLTDKTGTLTKNEIQIAKIVTYQETIPAQEVIASAYYTTLPTEAPDAIDMAIEQKFSELNPSTPDVSILQFVPYDGERKRSTVFVQYKEQKILVSVGAPQVIKSFISFNSVAAQSQYEQDIINAAQGGYRTLAVAIKHNDAQESSMTLAGLLFLSDPLDESSKETISFLQQNGVEVKISTGDNRLITQRIAGELALAGDTLSLSQTQALYQNPEQLYTALSHTAAFSEILPKDKYELVKALKNKYVIAATGDGVNDLPALKMASVSIAVSGAVSALKSMADFILLGRGIAVIKDAIVESRKIFVRLYNYSVYRISESFRLIITILILGISTGSYPLEPLQLILLAVLNDIPIISLATDRVKISARPAEIQVKQRMTLSLLFGSVGWVNSLLLFFILLYGLHLPLGMIQTMFFLKLTVSGHALIFVAHTKERWFKFLPSKEVIIATLGTQVIATALAISGFLMPSKISWVAAVLVWAWALFWMQVTEYMKDLQNKIIRTQD